jgi:2-oxoisovalerate dehydrogenase E1 component
LIEAKGPAAELTDEQLLKMYELMLTGRLLETRLHNMYRGGRLPGAVYPGVGQEGCMVGFAFALEQGDIYGGTHRDLMSQLTRGVTLEETLLNFYGKEEGPTAGRDGNSHFGVLDKGTLMVVSNLPDAWPVAVGVALAFKLQDEPRVAMANCGEGATATGNWHEAVNFGAVFKLPVVFTVQNNQWAYSTPNHISFPTEKASDRAKGYGIPGQTVDGNDVLACYSAAKEAVERARQGGGPSLIEGVTFRHFGHAGHDPADYVKPDEREEWMAKDPLPRFEEFLMAQGLLDDDRKAELEDQIEKKIRETIDWAQEQADPDPATAGDFMFAEREGPLPDAPPEGEGVGEEITLLDALSQAMAEEMEADERVFLFGEDVGDFGGAFKVTKGLLEKFGPNRVLDAPISEAGIVGAAVGAALQGLVPIAEMQYIDFLYHGVEQLVNEAAKYHWKTRHPVQMVVRGPAGAGVRAGPFHSANPEGLFSHHPGIKVVVPTTAYNAKGLLKAAIRDPNPVVVLEHKKLYRGVKGQVPEGDYEVALGRARLAREGDDLTIVTWGAMTYTALEAADQLAEEDVSVEVIDLQSIVPLDWETVFESVRKTARLVVVQEDMPVASVASEVAAVVAEELFWDLDGPVVRVAPPNAYVPFAPILEDAYLPQVEDVVKAVQELAAT